jgi:hypothetical protein
LKIVSKIELIIKNPLSEQENHEGIPELSSSLANYGIDFDPEKMKRLLPIDVERLQDLLKILDNEQKIISSEEIPAAKLNILQNIENSASKSGSSGKNFTFFGNN